MKIICMGDSITYGYGLDDLSKRWTDLVAAATGHTLINCGISGDTTGGMLARCQHQVFAQEADAMLLLGGINDISLTGQYRGACANVVAMVRQAQAQQLPVILGLPLPVVPRDIVEVFWDTERNAQRTAELGEQYAYWLQHYAEDNQIPCVDFRTPFLLSDGMPDRTLFQDGLHPTEEGHRRMAEAVCRVLGEIRL